MRGDNGGTRRGAPQVTPGSAAKLPPVAACLRLSPAEFVSPSCVSESPRSFQLARSSEGSHSQSSVEPTPQVPPFLSDSSYVEPPRASTGSSDLASGLMPDRFASTELMPFAGDRRAFLAFRAASGFLSNSWNLSSLPSLLTLTFLDLVRAFDRFFVSAPSHLYELTLYVCAAAQLSPRNLFSLSFFSSHPSLSCSSSSAFWLRVSRDPQRRSIHEMVSTVPFELDTLALLQQAPLVGVLLLTYPDETLRALETKILPDTAAKLLSPLSLELRQKPGQGVEDQQSESQPGSQEDGESTTALGKVERQLLLKTAPPCKVRLTRFPLLRHVERDEFR